MNNLYAILVVVTAVSLNGCSSAPKSHAPIVEGSTQSEISTSIPSEYIPEYSNDKGSEIFNFAQGFLGTPYRYGGGDPSGFDCSGLVQYTHSNFGINVPRTAAAQFNSSQPVSYSDLRPGDVVFFRLNRHKISHVGIYAGNGQFIHAPNRGKRVSFSRLNDPYWQKRLVKAGRFY